MTLSLLCVRESTGVFQRVGRRQEEGGREGGWEERVGCDREITWFTHMYSPAREGKAEEGKEYFYFFFTSEWGNLLNSLLTGRQRGAVQLSD